MFESKMVLFFYRPKQNKNHQRRNSGRSMLNQSKELLCIYVSFQESQESIKEDAETIK